VPLILVLLLAGCAVNNPLAQRVQKPADRVFYARQFGYSVPTVYRNAYIDGRIIPGMKRALVFDLMGEPDEQVVEVGEVWYNDRPYPLCETTWIYFQEQDTILTVRMRDSLVTEVR